MNKFLFLAGSSRKESFNKKLSKLAYNFAKQFGANSNFIDLKDFDIPIYNQDLEDAEGLPKNARELKKIFCSHQGIFISSPEYNSSISSILKNSLDWISRKEDKDEKPLSAFEGKVIALSSASPGKMGGIRGLASLSSMLSNMKTIVLPTKLTIGDAYNKFDQEGNLINKEDGRLLQNLIDELIITTCNINH